jgi:hypothetical protein
MKKLRADIREKEAREIVFKSEVFTEIISALPSNLIANDSTIRKNIVIDSLYLIGESSIELYLLAHDTKYHIGYLKIYDDSTWQYIAYKASGPIGNSIQ